MPVGYSRFDWLKQMGSDAPLLFHISHSPQSIGIAVSGGSDSTALLHLYHQAAAKLGLTLRAVTLDHALRAESAAEAAAVAAMCQSLGIAHDTLRWDHGTIVGNLQDQARQARYRLIAAWAREKGLADVAIGHTADDQAETFLMGLSRAAGLDGLSGMRPTWQSEGVKFHRPLLAISRADLRAYLTRHGVTWVDDPSNENDRFTRVKARRALQALRPLGITVDRLSDTIQHLAMAQQSLRRNALTAWTTAGREEAGAVHFDWAKLLRFGGEIERRLLLAAIEHIAGNPYQPRAEKIFNLRLAISQGRGGTLHGCRVTVANGIVSLYREPKAVKSLHTTTTEIWDNRWQMIGPHAPDLTIRVLGADGLRACPDWRTLNIPRHAILVSPAIWSGNTLMAAPVAGFAQGWQAKLTRDLNEVILSH